MKTSQIALSAFGRNLFDPKAAVTSFWPKTTTAESQRFGFAAYRNTKSRSFGEPRQALHPTGEFPSVGALALGHLAFAPDPL
jgi:hypothetical protein